MAQESVWEQEYKNPKLVTKDSKPQKDVLRYLKYLRKDCKFVLEDASALDLGSGTGRNSNYIAKHGAAVTGIEISTTAIKLAADRAEEMEVIVTYHHKSMGEPFPIEDNSINLILDITSSNSLTEAEREVYLKECSRVLQRGGHMFVKTLCKDGDKNAKALIAKFPGEEKDTYVNQDMGLTERVFTHEDFKALYEPFFVIDSLRQKTNYTRFGGQSYKRNFWLAYMHKE